MKYLLIIALCITLTLSYKSSDATDNDFAEFEEFEEIDIESHEHQTEIHDNPSTKQSENANNHKLDEDNDEDEDEEEDDDDEMMIDDDGDGEFEHFHDFEEFEGYEMREDTEKPLTEPKITITKVPSVHFRANWDNYWLEILMVIGLVTYFINFAFGKTKNTRIADKWLRTHRGLLEDNFAMVGDDGTPENGMETVGFVKDSENLFTLWCSGRTCCEGMLVELKLIKRQDLVSIIGGMMRPTVDQIHIKITMNRDDMDSFVFCVATKKMAQRLVKDMIDLGVYCPERKSGERHNLPAHFNVMAEMGEVASAMLDSKIVAVLNKYPDTVEYLHFSDQYAGYKQADENTLKLPETQKVLLFGFNLQLKNTTLDDAIEQMKPLMMMVFYCIEKVKRYRLSKEGKQKADKNRQKVEEAFLKSTHQARAEAAAARREEKRRLEKEKIMAEEDPERQRRWEEKEQKRQAKKRAPKMKQLKVKAL